MSQWDKILWCKYLICSWSNRHLPPMLLHLPRHLTLHVTPLIQHVYVYGSRRRCQNVIRQSQPNGFCGSACVTNITPCNCYYASNSGHCYCSQKNSPSTNQMYVWLYRRVYPGRSIPATCQAAITRFPLICCCCWCLHLHVLLVMYWSNNRYVTTLPRAHTCRH